MSIKQVVFDSNVLINAYLAPPSISAEAIRLVVDKKIRGLVCLATVEEAKTKLKSHSQRTGIDIHSYFQSFLQYCGVKMIRNPQLSDLQKVDESITNDGDRHVVATAQMIGASICTNDMKDINLVSTHGLVCQTPDELTYTGEITASTIVKGLFCRPDQGCIVLRIKPCIWRADFQNKEPVSTGLLEVPGLFYMDLVTGSNLITFQFTSRPMVSLKIDSIFNREDYPLTVFVSYSNRKNINLFALSSSGKLLESRNQIKWACPDDVFPITAAKLLPRPNFTILINYVAMFHQSMGITAINRLMAGKTTDNAMERLGIAEMIEFFHSE